MDRYTVTNSFAEKGFEHVPSERGTVEQYVYDRTEDLATGDSYRVRFVVLIDLDNGKPRSVLFNVFKNEDMLFFESFDIDCNDKSGEDCEREALEYISDSMQTINRQHQTAFTLKD